jgi:hypothetical protein
MGVPDTGLLTLTEIADCARRIVDAIDLPVLADGEPLLTPAFHKKGKSGMKAPRVCRKKGKHDPLLVWYQNKPCLIHGIHFHNFDTLKKGFLF